MVLVPEGKRRESDRDYRQTSADQSGKFSLQGIAPGEYRLFAFDDVEFGAYMDPDWLKPYESEGERISVGEGGKLMRDLKLIVTE